VIYTSNTKEKETGHYFRPVLMSLSACLFILRLNKVLSYFQKNFDLGGKSEMGKTVVQNITCSNEQFALFTKYN
jgi:hypothetical protein